MSNPIPLNPDARRAAFEAVQAIDGPASIGSMEIVDVAVSAYLEVAQPEPKPDHRGQRMALGQLLEGALRQCGISMTWALSGPSELYDVAGILLREYPTLAVTQPEVNSVEELITTRAGLALANAAFKEGLSAGIRACNESLEGEPFVKPVSPYSAPLLAMIKAERPEVKP